MKIFIKVIEIVLLFLIIGGIALSIFGHFIAGGVQPIVYGVIGVAIVILIVINTKKIK